jgi:hypothetical protein
VTNGVAIFLALAAGAALAADGYFNGWTASLFLADEVMDLIDLVTFWR